MYGYGRPPCSASGSIAALPHKMRGMKTLTLFLALAATSHAASPNVLLINLDDFGYGDLACHGAKGWTTPNLDSLARQGIRFTDFYVAQPVCSASRAALLTGCYPNRIGIAGALNSSAKVGIHANETTLAEIFQSKGYATGIAGKWHLGHHKQFLPTRHGFDSWLGLPYSNDMWPYRTTVKPGTHPPLPLYENESVIDADVTAEDQTTLTRRYTQRALDFITANRAKPFFFYLAHTMPHVPLYGDPKFQGTSAYGRYGDIIQEIDAGIGEILAALKKHDLEAKTLVIFTSDNGPWLPYGKHAGTSGGLREGKGTVWEGGVRVPCLMRWPGVIPPGSVCREPAMTIDFLPTLAKLIGAELPKQKIDGLDILPLVKAEPGAKSPHESYAFYYRQNELQALRSGRWKLLLPHTYPSLAGNPPGNDGIPGKTLQKKIEQPELYDLEIDVAESINVAAKHPDVVAKLMTMVEAYRVDLGDALTKRTGKGNRVPGREP